MDVSTMFVKEVLHTVKNRTREKTFAFHTTSEQKQESGAS